MLLGHNIINFRLTSNCRLGAVSRSVLNVCVSFPPYIPNHSGMSFSQVHSSNHQTLNPRLSVFVPPYIRPHLSLSPCLSFPPSPSQWDSGPITTFSAAYDLSGHILPVPDLQRQSSLGKALADWFTDTGDGRAPQRSAGARIASLSHELGLYSGLAVI